MGVSVIGDNAEELYGKYCAGLETKLKASEPYYTSVEMKELKKERIITDMKELLPQRVEKFDKLIEKAAELLQFWMLVQKIRGRYSTVRASRNS